MTITTSFYGSRITKIQVDKNKGKISTIEEALPVIKFKGGSSYSHRWKAGPNEGRVESERSQRDEKERDGMHERPSDRSLRDERERNGTIGPNGGRRESQDQEL